MVHNYTYFNDFEIEHESDHAILVSINGEEASWIPTSQIDESSVNGLGIADWLCRERGIL